MSKMIPRIATSLGLLGVGVIPGMVCNSRPPTPTTPSHGGSFPSTSGSCSSSESSPPTSRVTSIHLTPDQAQRDEKVDQIHARCSTPFNKDMPSNRVLSAGPQPTLIIDIDRCHVIIRALKKQLFDIKVSSLRSHGYVTSYSYRLSPMLHQQSTT